MDRNIIQSYLNNFRIYLSPHLKKDVGVKATVWPHDSGVIIRFELEVGGVNKEEFKHPTPTLLDALHKANVDLPDALNSYHKVLFAGTNMVLRGKYIFFIKDLEPGTWSEDQAATDVINLIDPTTFRNSVKHED